jgi:endonuclease YncB( thermonuclease family)
MTLPLASVAGSGGGDTAWHICAPYEKRITCIVDGDTLWFRGEKMRLLDIDAPEVDGACAQERRLANRAARRLLSLANSGVITITRYGTDDYGRTLVRVETGGGMVGEILLSEGLADRFGDGIRPTWCD